MLERILESEGNLEMFFYVLLRIPFTNFVYSRLLPPSWESVVSPSVRYPLMRAQRSLGGTLLPMPSASGEAHPYLQLQFTRTRLASLCGILGTGTVSRPGGSQHQESRKRVPDGSSRV